MSIVYIRKPRRGRAYAALGDNYSGPMHTKPGHAPMTKGGRWPNLLKQLVRALMPQKQKGSTRGG